MERTSFLDRLWLTDLTQLKRWPRLALHSVRRLFMAVELFINGNLSSHAAALTYSSVLGAVPILAIVFAVSRGFGFERIIQEKLAENVRFTPEMSQMLMDFINSYLERAKGGVFIGVGLVMLFYTLINLISNIETSFNTIWRVNTSRNIYRRVVDYISIFFLLPIVIVVTSGLQIFLMGIGNFLPSFTFVSDSIELLVQLTPLALSCLAFILLYKLMPNTDVRWSATIVPGLLAGLAFQVLQWFYIHSQLWISTYNAVYGSFAAIPLFMLWLQLSWTICLFGGQLSYAHQMEADFAFEKAAPHLSRAAHDRVAQDIVHRLCEAFDRGEAMSAAQLATEARLPLSLVNSILYELTADETRPLVNEVLRGKRSTPYFQPAMNTDLLTDEAVLDYFYHLGDEL
ncbi:MAG: YihY/virulence factor BrkB family protein [Bacteroidaceae bacterium]|nr:YihY/virulence factor BrkB family protein [Bacteroidaceae bacterium]